MKQITDYLSLFHEDHFHEAIFSSSEKNKKDKTKVIVRLIGPKHYQFSRYALGKVKHQNVNESELDAYLMNLHEEYRQIVLRHGSDEYHLLKMGQKGYKVRLLPLKMSKNAPSHDRPKQYILNEGDPIPYLVKQGVMSENYLVKASMQHKFRQINRFLEFIRDTLDDLATDRPLHIVDFGCGKSYLTFAVYDYFTRVLHREVSVRGLDLKEDVIAKCNQWKEELGYDGLTFEVGDIASDVDPRPIDLMISLHACDTATDYALAHAIRHQAKVILSAPCCQHEWHLQMHDTPLDSLFRYGVIQERTSALLTDAFRALLLESVGYRSQILEFIDLEHTPKNLLIRAVYHGKKINHDVEINQLLNDYHVSPTLYRLLKESHHE